MIQRYALVLLVVHVAYAAAWLSLSNHSEQAFERWSVVCAATVMTLAYGIFSGAYYWANKTRLNTAIAANKLFLCLFFGLLTLPVLWGIALHAPYDLHARNPYALFVVPPWIRCYLYWGVSLTSIAAVYEFWRRNWGPGSRFDPDPPAEPPDFLLSTDVVVSHK